MEGKHRSESKTEQVQVIRPMHLNGTGRLFGGQLALWIDEVAGIAAMRHSGRQIVTACIDNLRFKEPVLQGQLVVLEGIVTYAGTSSMEVRVDSYVESSDGMRRLINTAFLVEVAIQEDGTPAKIPPLICDTPQEIRDFEAGKKRKELRLRMNHEIYDSFPLANSDL